MVTPSLPTSVKKLSGRPLDIVLAALECFSRAGIEATTIEMIREASGASVGSLYHHFGSKERIAAEVYMEGLRRYRELQWAYLAEVTTTEQGVKAVVHAHVDWIHQNPDWARFVFNHRPVLAQSGDEARYQQEMRASNHHMMNWFAQRKEAEGEVLRTLPAEIYASVIVGPVHDYAKHWLDGRKKIPLIELREIFSEIAWCALRLN